MNRLSALVASAGFLLAATTSTPAWAQDEEEDVLGDILAEDSSTETVGEERADLLNEEEDVASRIAALEAEAQSGQRRLIKTLQQKTFLKIDRWEIAPHAGLVTNDAFQNRYLVGASGTYHLTEVFAVELWGTFSPDFGDGDYTSLTEQLIQNNNVAPEISKVQGFGTVDFQFSPVYGKLAFLRRSIINFDFYGVFGLGVARTKEELDTITSRDNDPIAEATQFQFHPITNIGGGFRLIFSKSFATRIEGRSISYVETVNSSRLEMKNSFFFAASASFFFPGLD